MSNSLKIFFLLAILALGVLVLSYIKESSVPQAVEQTSLSPKDLALLSEVLKSSNGSQSSLEELLRELQNTQKQISKLSIIIESDRENTTEYLLELVAKMETDLSASQEKGEKLLQSLTEESTKNKKLLENITKLQEDQHSQFQKLIDMRSQFHGGNHSLAIVVPFRNRTTQLEVFSRVMHTYFQGIDIKWRIVVVEQGPKHPFNRAKLCNIGYHLSRNWSDYFCCHDVDHIPAQPYVDYSYPESNPRHLSMHSQSTSWKLPYPTIFGGVSCFSSAHFQRLNGYSNEFWGWGGEDDEIRERINIVGLKVDRPPHACFFALSYEHTREKLDQTQYSHNTALLAGVKYRWSTDGLNNLVYSVNQTVTDALYIKHTVNVKPSDPDFDVPRNATMGI